jgi:hypothetical protein
MAFQFFDRSIRLPTTAAEIAHRISGAHDQWLMTDAERGTLRSLLSMLKPKRAIEVGVYRAGSLAIIAEFCEKVYALDVDPYCQATYAGQLPNVEFITGPSGETLPRLIDHLQATGEGLDFVLIDADHSGEGVRRDVNNVLRYEPTRPLCIVMHDSFNPGCRGGMRAADWSANPYVHLVELDFVPGRFITKEEGDGYRQMWCGLALAMLLPEKRAGEVVIRENEFLMYRTALRHSVYRFQRWWNPLHSLPQAARSARSGAVHMLRTYAPKLFAELKARRSTSA